MKFFKKISVSGDSTRSVPARTELMKVKITVPWMYMQGVSTELGNDRGRWGMAGPVSGGWLFHPKHQVEEQNGNLQVKNLMGAPWGSKDSAQPWNPHMKLTNGESDKSDVSFHPTSLLQTHKEKLGKRNYFISEDQKLSLTSSQTKFGIMWVTQWKLVM